MYYPTIHNMIQSHSTEQISPPSKEVQIFDRTKIS